ncbi:MAG: hypothetical protein LBV60_10395 [Streptomyces sp.]|nr:hypothetical protein [Streptomyces sp.]
MAVASDEQGDGGYEQLSGSSRGERKDYALERRTLSQGGQAEVFRATHKSSGITVALKRRLGGGIRARRRMRREIEIGRLLGAHPHVMPVLDSSPDNSWFVTPLAEATAEDLGQTS